MQASESIHSRSVQEQHGFQRLVTMLESDKRQFRFLRYAIQEEVDLDLSRLIMEAETELQDSELETRSLAAVLLLSLKEKGCHVAPSSLQRADEYVRKMLINSEEEAFPSLAFIVVLGVNGSRWADEIGHWIETEDLIGELALIEAGQRERLTSAHVGRLATLITHNPAIITLALDGLIQIGLRYSQVWDALMLQLAIGDTWIRSIILLALIPIKENQQSARHAVQLVLQDKSESPEVQGMAKRLLELIDMRLQTQANTTDSKSVEAIPGGGQVLARVKAYAWIMAAVLYFICPLDLDFIPLVGWCDDLVVAYLCTQKSRACLAA